MGFGAVYGMGLGTVAMHKRSSSIPTGRTFRGLSHDERIAQRRKQLLEAGLATFGARGFHAVSVRDVCAEAKLTERYFYESFQNREALFLAVYSQGVERVRAEVQRAVASAEPTASSAARAGLHAYFSTLRKEPLLSRVLLIDVLTIGSEAGSQSLVATTSFVAMVTSTIAELYPDLRRHELDPRWIGTGLVGASVFMAMQWALSGFEEPVERVVENCSAFVDGLVSLVRAPRKAGKRRARPLRARRES